jgi:hypothetical protein
MLDRSYSKHPHIVNNCTAHPLAFSGYSRSKAMYKFLYGKTAHGRARILILANGKPVKATFGHTGAIAWVRAQAWINNPAIDYQALYLVGV